jgi:hypothetical protein
LFALIPLADRAKITNDTGINFTLLFHYTLWAIFMLAAEVTMGGTNAKSRG